MKNKKTIIPRTTRWVGKYRRFSLDGLNRRRLIKMGAEIWEKMQTDQRRRDEMYHAKVIRAILVSERNRQLMTLQNPPIKLIIEE